MRNVIVLIVVLLCGSSVWTTAKSQNKRTFNGYNRESKHIVIYDAEELVPIDSVPVKEQLQINSKTSSIIEQKITNEEIFKLMEAEEAMREQRPPNNGKQNTNNP